MGVIIKYVLAFKGKEKAFTVSNDLLKGDFIIDAGVEAEMTKGAVGGSFKIELHDLPEDYAADLYQNQESPAATVGIKLGYMDGAFDTVMDGIYTKVTVRVEGDSLITTIKGEESGAYALRRTPPQSKSFVGSFQLKTAVENLLKDAFPGGAASTSAASGLAAAAASLLGNGSASGELIVKEPKVQNVAIEVKDASMRGENLMTILDRVSRDADAEFLVVDKTVHIGKPIKNDDYSPDEFDRDVNLAKFEPFAKTLPDEANDNRLVKLPPHSAQGFKFIIAGDPHLRPAQQVFANVETKVKDKVEGYRKRNGAEFRIDCLVHKLTMNGGYICEGLALKPPTDEQCRRQQDVLCKSTASGFVQTISQMNRDEVRRNPVVEVGSVKQYNSGAAGEAPHRATFYFGQRFARTETQPSTRAEVEAEETKLLQNKPFVSPFAWHKCGLVVPVYPGMKALLNHNLGLTDDALVTGFLWSQEPNFEPPKSQEGDWWLCLPIDFDPSSPPTDSTKAANDLITNKGLRVIEVKGMKITVGTNTLKNVGVRPQVGRDDELSIEHASGAKILIKDGEIQLTDGKVTLKISGGTVDIS